MIGFSRTFFLRTFFAVPPIPPHVYLHGAILTSWFVWFCVQASLVARRRRGLHRTLGKVGAALGVAVIVANLTVLAGVAPRLRVVFLEEKLDPTFVTRAIWGDFGSTLAFAVFLGAGRRFGLRNCALSLLWDSRLVDSTAVPQYADFMDLDVPPELEAKLDRLAAETGRRADQLALDL